MKFSLSREYSEKISTMIKSLCLGNKVRKSVGIGSTVRKSLCLGSTVRKSLSL